MWAAQGRRPIIGRERELAVLESRLEDAAGGDGRVVLVGGEAGVGKSRLVAELATRAERAGFLTLGGECVDMGEGGLPYGPFAVILRRALEHVGELDGIPGWARKALTALVPGAGPGDEAAGASPDQFARARLLEAIVETFSWLSRRQPVLIVLEDIHWADGSTRDLLTFLSTRLPGEPVLIVCTHRTERLGLGDGFATWLAELDRRPTVERLELARFTRTETAACMAALIGRPPDADLLDAVHRRSDGIAFAVEELTAAALDGGPDALPPAIRDSILATLSTLRPVAREVVAAAATIGHIIDDRLLGEVVTLTSPDLVRALRELVEERILVGAAEPARLAFRHALTREVAYLDLLPAERRAWHARVADALEARRSRSASAEELATIAFHRDAAGEPRTALPAAIAAADGAERVYAFADAARWLDRALALWDAVDSVDRPGGDHAELVARSADAAAMAGDATRACELLRGAITELGDTGDPARRARLWERLADYLWLTDLPGRIEAAREAVRLLSLEPPSPELARATWVLAGELAGTEGAAAGVPMMESAIDVAIRAGATVEEATARLFHAAIRSSGKSVSEAIRLGHEAVRIATEARRPRELCYAYIDLVYSLDVRGDLEEAVTSMREALDAGRRFGFLPLSGGLIPMNGVDALNLLGRWDEATELLLGSMGESDTTDRRYNLMLAQTATWRGELGEAQRRLEAAALDEVHSEVNAQALRTHAVYEAELALANADIERVRTIVDRWRDEPWTMTTADIEQWTFFRIGLAAEADAAADARRRGDRAALGVAASRAADLVERVRGRASTLASDERPLRSVLATAVAESTRVDAPGDPEAWAVAEESWMALPSEPWIAYCRYRRVEAWLGRERPDRAVAAELLRGAHQIASQLGARLLAEDVSALARRARIDLVDRPTVEPTAKRRPEPRDPLGLTEREREILELVAAGLTNREISERLFISPKTAGVHVSNILGKLGVRGRVEAAAHLHRERRREQ